ncbi:MAG: sugar phosphate isomerase/epimerase [Planctomycetaceae bacterium]|nr:sugar phosphate isomerase/epimerase [Planctomycetaceae bacterium]
MAKAKTVKASAPKPCPEGIRIGTLAGGGPNTAAYIKQILPYGFESFSITWFGSLGGADLKKISSDVKETLAGSGAVISSISFFGNPLDPTAGNYKDSVAGWKTLVDNCHLFGCDLVTGFAGRVINKPISDSMPAYKKFFGELAKRAADKGVRIAFENCDMGGDWWRGDWNCAHNPTAWDMMFNEVPAKNIGLQWEPCHQMVSLIDPIPQLRKYAKKVFCLHGKDGTVDWNVVREHGVDGPHQFAWHRTPGFGDTNWTDVITILRMNGFVGSIDIEGWHDPVYRGELEMTGQVRGLNYLKACRGGSYVPNPS